MGTALFKRQPTSEAVRAFLGRVIDANKSRPKHLITDRGSQFDCEGSRQWCQKKGIKPRFGALGRHGSIAVIERLILTVKQNIAWLPLVSLRSSIDRYYLNNTNVHRISTLTLISVGASAYHPTAPRCSRHRYKTRLTRTQDHYSPRIR
jgi:transposase InsO family protein